MKKLTIAFVLIAVMIGLAGCKKNNETTLQETVKCYPFTIDVEGDAKAGITPQGNGALAEFKVGDVMYVAYKGKFVGSCKKYGNSGFSGTDGGLYITDTEDPEPLELYYLAATQIKDGDNPNNFWTEEELWKNKVPDPTAIKAHVPISKQNVSSLVGSLPIIAYGETKQVFTPNETSTKYTAKLHHKCALVKFSVNKDIPAGADIFIDGLNNMVYAYFDKEAGEAAEADNDGFLFKSEAGKRDQSNYTAKYKGKEITSIILPYRTDNVCYAIMLPQKDVDFSNINSYYYKDNDYLNEEKKVELVVSVTDLNGSIIKIIKEGEYYIGTINLKPIE